LTLVPIAEKIQRLPAWLHRTWIQDFMYQVIALCEQEEDKRGAEVMLDLLQTVAKLRYVPSASEAESLKVISL